MAKNRILLNPDQHPSVMSSPRAHTVSIVAEDDDDNDICPVCDGECTCSNNTPPIYQQLPPRTTTSSAHDLPRPVLKIKLPANLLKQKLPRFSQPTSGPSSSSYSVPGPSAQPPHVPKKRGRPPKNPALRAGPGPSTSAYQRSKPKPAPRTNLPQKKTSKSLPTVKDGGIRKKAIKKRKRVDSSDESSSELTDTIDHRVDDDDDAQSLQFPTFVSAISSSSSGSSSDSGSLSGFDTDSSIEAEEENFILAEERARVRRELLNGGGGEESMQKRRDNSWVIRPRQMSVGAASDVDMDDSDATEDDNDDEDDEQEEDEDEPDGEETEDMRHGYGGLVTAWSDDEESSFDADLFFANLSDDVSGYSTQSDDGDEGDRSDLDPSEAAAHLIPHLRQGVGIGVPNLAFEVSEGWDGQVIFTNGLVESSFETAFLPPGPEATPSPGPDGDVDMLSTDADGEPDEEGYERDIDQDTAEGEGEGDTTDEELVGEDDLPNDRAMSLFNTPFSFNIASINPMSTMSPFSSPPRQHHHPFATDSPRPSDILAQQMQWRANDMEEKELGSEEPSEEEESAAVREQKEKDKAARGGLPRTGYFEVAEKTRQVVIDGESTNIPSSYPRFTGRRGKGIKSMSVSHTGRIGGFESLLRKSFTTPLRPSSLPPPSTRSTFLSYSALPLSPSSEVADETTLASSINITSPGSTSASQPDDSVAQPMSIDLDDVLDASFLTGAESVEASNGEPPIAESSSAVSNSDDPSSRRYIESLNRWDVISVGALRKTGVLSDSAAGWGSDSGPDYTAYSNVMKSSPLSTMLWHNRNSAPRQQRSLGYAMSPELGPIKDGDRTPTNAQGSQKHNNDTPPLNSKSRRELRKERQLKRKSYGPVKQHKQPRPHHQHHHHPNSKSRTTSSSQRMNFSGGSVPPLSI
ncbi:hypothetical protein BDP27DRAFT_1310800 [Rhodocollybia butyracea]|uniref:Uncharacterized protein n=1 Tax=Rhodocollybia butyracea TaxID=206335 RepID=A0A9P5QCF0_9AGAR|nr:hypothetical protein BDP27DRAFT_1310800 [Rhodocollybia butyracea]